MPWECAIPQTIPNLKTSNRVVYPTPSGCPLWFCSLTHHDRWSFIEPDGEGPVAMLDHTEDL